MASGTPPEILPPDQNNNTGEDKNDRSRNGGFMSVENLHLHANDLHALARIAETDPELAKQIVNQRDEEDRRFNISYRFGIVGAVFLMFVILVALTVILLSLGAIAATVVIGIALGLALLIRVILTGEWSETTWFGKLVKSIRAGLGSVSDTEDNP